MLEPEVIYKNEDFLVLNKPAGMLVHTANLKFKNPFSSNATVGRQDEKLRWPTLTGWLIEKYPEVKKVGDNPEERPGIVHRLDKDTSGVMVVARNQRTFEYLKKLFSGGSARLLGGRGSSFIGQASILKIYLALVYGKVKNEKGIIDKPIGIKPGTIKRTIFSDKMKKEAVTEYKLVSSIKYQVSSLGKEKNGQDFSLLEVRPRTGRTHQIRVHLASIGHQIVNDPIYASKKEKIGNGRLMLHAKVLEFTAEDGRRMRFEAEPPEDFRENLDLGYRT